MKRMVLGAILKKYTHDDSMYKECQKENCYQIFLFLRVSLFLLFFLNFKYMFCDVRFYFFGKI